MAEHGVCLQTAHTECPTEDAALKRCGRQEPSLGDRGGLDVVVLLELLLLLQPLHKQTHTHLKFFIKVVLEEDRTGISNYSCNVYANVGTNLQVTTVKEGISELTTQLAGRNAHETKCQGIYYIFIPVVKARRGPRGYLIIPV